MANCPCCGQEIKPAPRPKRLSKSQVLTKYPREYQDGYKTGLNWDASWYPGGPCTTDPDARRAWLRGFDNGLDRRLKENKRFRNWWVNQRRKACNYARYSETTGGQERGERPPLALEHEMERI